MNDPEPQESVAQALNLPQITTEALLVGGVVLLVGLGVAFVVRLLVRTLLRWRGRGTSAVRVFGRIAGWLVALLAVGVARIEGTFPAGVPVDIAAPDGQLIARGLVGFSSEELRVMSGHGSAELRESLGERFRRPAVHRDQMVLL